MRLRLAHIGLLATLVAAPISAQLPTRIVGRVIGNDDQRPLAFTDVQIRRADGSFLAEAQSDSAGAFEFVVDRGVSAVRIFARRLGYESTGTPLLHFDYHRFIQVEVRMDTDAVLLAPLEVVVWSDIDRSPLLDNFRRRQEQSMAGIFITRRDIEQRRPMYASDMLRTIPGVELTGGGGGTRPRIVLNRSVGMRCSTQIFVDGMLLNRRSFGPGSDFRLDDVVSPGSIEGMEIYKGLSGIPPEFLTPEAECGVIAVWTRRGGSGGEGAEAR